MEKQNKKIFITDDDLFFTSVLKGLIEDVIPNANIHTFQNVNDCMGKIFQKPDLIFLDYNFNNNNVNPQLDGISGLSLMMSYYPLAKIIMVSSKNNTDRLYYSKKIGATDFLIKDTNLGKEIANILDRILFPIINNKER